MLQIDPFSTFDRVYVVSLARRPERIAAFQRKIDEVQWPFRPIEVFKAIDGEKVKPPQWYKSGGGAWGCLRSHSGILERCLNDGVQSVLILEDDAYFFKPETFADDCATLLNAVPDWECLFLGGQHTNETVRPPIPHVAGVVKCADTQRTHAYALRGKIIGDLYRFWADCKTHCDWPLGQFTAAYRTYAPETFLIGQDEGKSDISGADNPKKAWVVPSADRPIYLFLNTPRDVIEQLRGKGFHFGRRRDAEGRDVGLNDEVFGRHKPIRRKAEKLKAWVKMIDWEAVSMGDFTAIWHPDIGEDVARAAEGSRVVVLNGISAEEAVRVLNEGKGK